MSKLLRLICMAVVLMLFTGCRNGDDPEPELQPVEETWLMTYDDYHSLLDIDESEKQKYRGLSRELTVMREGDVISIKGIFEEFPDSWVIGNIIGKKVYISITQAIGTDNGKAVYFKWGYVSHYSEHQYTGNTSGIIEPESIVFGIGRGPDGWNPALIISDDGNAMTTSAPDDSYPAFWYDDDNYIGYDTDRTGFPDVDIKVNISFRKVSGDK